MVKIVPLETGFFIFGLQRSGTNYIRSLMFNNFKDVSDRASWKHQVEVHTEERLTRKILDPAILIIYKNPYKWIESICNRHCVDWVKTQTKYPACQGLTIGKNNINPISLAKTYKEHYENWVLNAPEFISSRSTVIHYEQLLIKEKRSKILKSIEQKYNFERKSDEWINPRRVEMSSSFSQHNKGYYLCDRLDLLKPEHLKLMNEVFTEEFMNQIGYKRITEM